MKLKILTVDLCFWGKRLTTMLNVGKMGANGGAFLIGLDGI